MSWAGLSRFSFSLFSSSRHGRKTRRTGNRGQQRLVSSPEQLEARWALSADPIVTVDTNYGDFQIELLPGAAPQTVANFLSYVTSGAYTDTIFHRSEQPSPTNPNDIGIIQSGGFTSASTTYTSVSQFQTIPTNAPIPLEYDLANASGTVAMARLGGTNTATATDEFYINDIDNSTALGQSNGGGYAVFGKILGNGMQVVDTIAALSTIKADPTNFTSTFNQLPLGSNNQLARINSITLDSIDGTVFDDANRNGQLDPGESGVASRTVFLNLDGSGKPDASNPSTITDANGNFSFTGIAPGTYTVLEVLPAGFTATTPNRVITVTAGSTTSGVDLGEFSPLAIRGTVFDDVNLNGRQDTGENGLAGITVFLDVDGTAVPDANNPSTTTDANGDFSFSGLASGTYTVRQVLPSAGVTTTTPAVTVSVVSGQVATANLGDVLTSTILPLFVGGADAAQPSDSNASFINAVYVNVLDRTAEATGLAYWHQQLSAGLSRSEIVLQIWDSVEHRELEINEYYHEFLNRSADALGMAHWLGLFAVVGEKGVVEALVSSPEYSQEHASDADFVDALYHDIALRPADSAGLSYWQGQLAAGMTRAQVASTFINSPDATTRLVDELYSVLLQRAPNSTDQQWWVNQLENNSLTVGLAGVTFLSSDEYFGLHVVITPGT